MIGKVVAINRYCVIVFANDIFYSFILRNRLKLRLNLALGDDVELDDDGINIIDEKKDEIILNNLKSQTSIASTFLSTKTLKLTQN